MLIDKSTLSVALDGASADVVLLNKCDLLQVFEFDLEYFQRGVAMVNPEAPIFQVSCRSGAGMEAWTEWLLERVKRAG